MTSQQQSKIQLRKISHVASRANTVVLSPKLSSSKRVKGLTVRECTGPDKYSRHLEAQM